MWKHKYEERFLSVAVEVSNSWNGKQLFESSREFVLPNVDQRLLMVLSSSSNLATSCTKLVQPFEGKTITSHHALCVSICSLHCDNFVQVKHCSAYVDSA
jgi:hypothetical protein